MPAGSCCPPAPRWRRRGLAARPGQSDEDDGGAHPGRLRLDGQIDCYIGAGCCPAGAAQEPRSSRRARPQREAETDGTRSLPFAARFPSRPKAPGPRPQRSLCGSFKLQVDLEPLARLKVILEADEHDVIAAGREETSPSAGISRPAGSICILIISTLQHGFVDLDDGSPPRSGRPRAVRRGAVVDEPHEDGPYPAQP